MLIIGSILLLLANAVTLRREKSIFFNRVAILILLYSGILAYDSLYIGTLATGIGVFSGLFHSTAITFSFAVFIYSIWEGHTSALLRLQSSLHYSRYKHMILEYLLKISAALFQILFIVSALGLFGFGLWIASLMSLIV